MILPARAGKGLKLQGSPDLQPSGGLQPTASISRRQSSRARREIHGHRHCLCRSSAALSGELPPRTSGSSATTDGECRTENPRVGGSIPPLGTISEGGRVSLQAADPLLSVQPVSNFRGQAGSEQINGALRCVSLAALGHRWDKFGLRSLPGVPGLTSTGVPQGLSSRWHRGTDFY